MLALSRLEGGLPGMEREPVDVAELLRDCAVRARLEADQRGIRLRLDAPTPAVVSGSAILLERALDNLVSNAIKFSPEGGEIVLGAHVEAGWVRLSVGDQGPGVPPDELASLFQPFFRGSNAPRADGHGLGLAIVQRVAKVHGGAVHASNAAGGGLEVRLELPLAPVGEQA
jgi:signal transduction histidine kinase